MLLIRVTLQDWENGVKASSSPPGWGRGGTATWQRAAGAQQAGEMPTIGFPGEAAISAREP
jgi:hypothetical protein